MWFRYPQLKDWNVGKKSWNGPEIVEGLEKIALGRKVEVLSLFGYGGGGFKP